MHVADMADPAAPQSATGTQRFGFRGQLTVPMLRGGDPIGAITVVRRQPGLFSDDQIRQFAIFADQAVIAIENARLFRELIRASLVELQPKPPAGDLQRADQVIE